MGAEVLDSLAAEVTQDTDVMSSAATFINGSQARLEAAVKEALANGATAEQLAPVQAEVDALKARREELAAAVAANTPAAPSAPEG